MKYAKLLSILVLWAAVASAVRGDEPTFQQLLDECLPGMGAGSIPDRQQPQQKFQDACFALGTPGREAQREQACKLIAEKLGPETAKPARVWLLKQLEFIGRGECVDAVAGLLADQDREIRDAARRALASNPALQTTTKLLESLQAVKQEPCRIALLNLLGFRGDPASVGAIAGYLGDKSPAVASAAACALGRIGGPEAMKSLEAAGTGASDDLRSRIADALLLCADRLLAQGRTAEATAVYDKLASAENARPIHLAAMQGLLSAAGESAAEKVGEMLANPEADVRQIAAGFVAELSGPSAMKAFADGFAKLPAEGKVLLLAGLAAPGDKSAAPVAVEGAKSDVAEVQLAGIRALAKLGDASAVPLLIQRVAAGGDAAGPARESLQAVYGTGVDEAIVQAMRQAEVGLRGTLIDVLDARRAAQAVPALLEQATGSDAGIRSRAIRTLGNVGQPQDIPALVTLLLKSERGRERDDLEKAVMLVSARIPDPPRQAAPMLEILSKAGDGDRLILLPAVGRIGGEEALAAIQKALESPNAEIRDPAVRGLCNWPDAGVADELLKIVDKSDNQEHRIWALRAYIRVISLPSDAAAKQTLAMFQKAMEKAWRLDEKKLVLSRASAARCVETLRWVLLYVDDPELSRDASLAVVELAHRRELMTPNFEEFSAALKKVIDVCKDRGLADRAKRYLEGL